MYTLRTLNANTTTTATTATKDPRHIFYRSRVIAHFVQNFVAMATGVDQGKMWIAAFDGPTPKAPL